MVAPCLEIACLQHIGHEAYKPFVVDVFGYNRQQDLMVNVVVRLRILMPPSRTRDTQQGIPGEENCPAWITRLAACEQILYESYHDTIQ